MTPLMDYIHRNADRPSDWSSEELSGADFREILAMEAEIARLQELLRGTGANRYWEGRWRDADAENQKLRAALEELREWTDSDGPWHTIIDKALAKEGK